MNADDRQTTDGDHFNSRFNQQKKLTPTSYGWNGEGGF